MSQMLVLCYHAISPTWSAALSVTPESFERQATFLIRHGWTSATFSEAVEHAPAERTVVFTFDDAFESVKTYALPVLRRLGATGTVFAPTDYVSRRALLVWDGLERWEQGPGANELTPLSWDDLGELAEIGWEIGSHSLTHPMLTSLDDATLAAELTKSREECALRLGRPATSIAYPYGDVDDRVSACARDSGYAVGAALAWPLGTLDRYRYPRIGVYHKDTMPRFRLKTGPFPRTTYGARLLTRRR
jgi:peptidoglycan/xylan/chitin deacetylase (PgdA/CDA1 family)